MPSDSQTTATSSAPAEAEPTFDFEPPPVRKGLPVKVLDMRLRGEPVGTYRDREYPDGVPLQAIGLNQCQTGWVFQGFLRNDEGPLVATPPLHVPLPTLPVGRTTSGAPEADDRTLVLDLESASMRDLAGSIAIESQTEGPDAPIMKLAFDGASVGIATGPTLGGRGCFTTGFWRMEQSGDSLQGPVSAVWDQKNLHYVGLRLTEEHGIGVWLVLQPQHRQPANLIRADLARVGEKPKQYPLRVVFETREKSEDGMRIVDVAATEGEVNAAFTRANPQGPFRLQLRGLKFPDWDGPMAGKVVDEIRVETLLVTDPNGSSVPVPSEPSFEVPETDEAPR